MRVAVLQHADHEGPGAIAPWLVAHDHTLTTYRADAGRLPTPDAFDALLVMGGPQAVYDPTRDPWLRAELALIAAAIADQRRVLGICLGAQLVAAALGAPVTAHSEREIGWFEVQRATAATGSAFSAALPARLMTFHWHADRYALPAGAVRLFESAACGEQGFSVGARVLALQFHPEITPAMLDTWTRVGAAELSPAPWVQDAAAIRAGAMHCGAAHAMLGALLARWSGAAGAE